MKYNQAKVAREKVQKKGSNRDENCEFIIDSAENPTYRKLNNLPATHRKTKIMVRTANGTMTVVK